MLDTVVDVLVRPDAVFAEREDPALRWPAIDAVGSAVATTLWSGYVWVTAVQQARGLTRRQALLAVAIPVAFLLLN